MQTIERTPNPPRTHPAFETHDLSNKRKVWVVSDIHGCFKLLEKRLKAVEFNPKKDVLISVGDLINRGPDNHLVENWIPKMLRVIGNHEEIVARAQHAGPNTKDFDTHYYQGGAWFWDTQSPQKRQYLATLLWEAPVALEITTPAGNQIGIVHARVPYDNWQIMQTHLEDKNHPEHENTQVTAVWCRDQIDELHLHGTTSHVTGIQQVFFGHTPVKEITTHKNCAWIDTCAYKREQLAIIDIDKWLEIQMKNQTQTQMQNQPIY